MNTAFWPVILPLMGGVLSLFRTRPSLIRRTGIALVLTVLFGIESYLVFACYQGDLFFTRIGGWASPFGIVVVVDLLSALFLFFSTFILLSALLYAFATEEMVDEAPLRYPLVLFMLAGINLSLVTGDFFNLFVAFEVMLLASYGLMTLEAKKNDLPYAFSYIILNVMGSLLFLTTAGFVYGHFGTLNFSHLHQLMATSSDRFLVEVVAVLSLCIFGLKAALFPLYFWLPLSYPILPTPLAAIFGGILTKVGMYVLIRLFGSVFPPDLPFVETALLWIAGFTMLLGVLGAVAQETIKKILSYHIISQMGFMLLAIAFRSPAGIAAAIFYTLHNVIVKGSLFLIGGGGELVYGTDKLEKMGHLWGILPYLGFFFLLQGFSLAGLPPLSGFWAKYLVLLEGLEKQHYFLVLIAVMTGWLTLLSMIKIWSLAFWGPQHNLVQGVVPHRYAVRCSLFLPVALALFMGVGAQVMVLLVNEAARQATDGRHLAQVLSIKEEQIQ